MRAIARCWSLCLLLLTFAALAVAPLARANIPSGPHWVAVWAGVPSDSSKGTELGDLFAPAGNLGPDDIKQDVNNSTVRAIITPSLSGTTVRVHLSNRFGTVPATFAHTTIAKQGIGAALSGTPVNVTFGGGPEVTIAPGQDAVSDPVAFSYEAFENLAVSTWVSGNIGKATEHYEGRQTSYFTPSMTGDHTADSGGGFFLGNTTRQLVTGLDVRTSAPVGAVVTFGDSLTDGYQGLPPGFPENPEGVDANGRWPDVLGRRLRAAGVPLSVVNAGISGNRVLRDGTDGGGPDYYGPSALKRLQLDVLDQAAVTTVIWLEGINDLGQNPPASAAEVIGGYEQGIAQMHAAGLRVLMGTLTPSGGASGNFGSAQTEAARQQVNAWIRTNCVADGYVDFDAAVRDPNDPARLNPAYDGSDHLHLNLAGYQRMGEAVDLESLGQTTCGSSEPTPLTPHLKNETSALTLKVLPGKVRARHRVRIRFHVGAQVAGNLVDVRGAVIRLAGRRVRTNANGAASLRLRFRHRGPKTARATAPNYGQATARLRVRKARHRRHRRISHQGM